MNNLGNASATDNLVFDKTPTGDESINQQGNLSGSDSEHSVDDLTSKVSDKGSKTSFCSMQRIRTAARIIVIVAAAFAVVGAVLLGLQALGIISIPVIAGLGTLGSAIGAGVLGICFAAVVIGLVTEAVVMRKCCDSKKSQEADTAKDANKADEASNTESVED